MSHNPSSTRGEFGRLLLFAIFASSFVLIISLVLQWVIYDDWLHQTGPLRIVGTVMAALITFVFVYRWLQAEARRRAELMQRFATIAHMNDRIRNAVQAIEFTTYVSDPAAAEHVRQAVEVIDDALRGVVEEAAPLPISPEKVLPAQKAASKRNSA
jgi:hypothetical protein